MSLRPFGCVGVGALFSIVDVVMEDPSPIDVDVVWCVVAVDGTEKEEEEEYDVGASYGSVEYSKHPSILRELIEVPSPISVHSPRMASVAF